LAALDDVRVEAAEVGVPVVEAFRHPVSSCLAGLFLTRSRDVAKPQRRPARHSPGSSLPSDRGFPSTEAQSPQGSRERCTATCWRLSPTCLAPAPFCFLSTEYRPRPCPALSVHDAPCLREKPCVSVLKNAKPEAAGVR